LPRSAARGLYSTHQLRLLEQIRILRDDHNLPLDVIRGLFERFDFDVDRIESITLTDSLCKRVTSFVDSGQLLAAETLSERELADRVNVDVERVRHYVDARVVSPLRDGDSARYSGYDVATIALCEHGVALGIPFDSFRKIASYVRIEFDLEHAAFYGDERNLAAANPLVNVFVRREIARGFVQSVLHATTQRHVRELLEGNPERRSTTLDDVVYRPSDPFIRAHGIAARIEQLRDELRDAADDRQIWQNIARLLLHSGAYDEATFFLEESLQRFPRDARLACALGRALLLRGDYERGQQQLAALAGDGHAAVFSALAVFRQARAADSAEQVIAAGAEVVRLIDVALAALPSRGASGVEIATLSGWLMASLPRAYGRRQAGLALLRDTFSKLDRERPVDAALPGLRERQQINAAYLLLDCMQEHVDPATSGPDPERLRGLVCRLDPASRFAETAFLMHSRATGRERS